MSITVKYGPDRHEINTVNALTFGQVKTHPTAKAVLGFPDNTRALLAGIEQPDHLLVPEGSTVVLETRANAKAQP